MSAKQITSQAMDLPVAERVALAQALWDSVVGDAGNDDEQSVVQEAICRDADLSSGATVGRSHETVTQAARRAIGCK